MIEVGTVVRRMLGKIPGALRFRVVSIDLDGRGPSDPLACLKLVDSQFSKATTYARVSTLIPDTSDIPEELMLP